MTVMPPSASASAFIWFIMWTKKGKFRPGTDSRMVSGLSACASAEVASASPNTPASNVVVKRFMSIPPMPSGRGVRKWTGEAGQCQLRARPIRFI